MSLGDALPHINAVMNSVSCLAVCIGYAAIKNKRAAVHRRCMLTAMIASAFFLVGYLTRVSLTGIRRFPDVGAVKVIFLIILFSHMLLAIAVVPIVLRMLFLARHRRFAEHKRLGRFSLPIWLYVSVTGVVVYAMLYHLAPRLVGDNASPTAVALSAVCVR